MKIGSNVHLNALFTWFYQCNAIKVPFIFNKGSKINSLRRQKMKDKKPPIVINLSTRFSKAINQNFDDKKTKDWDLIISIKWPLRSSSSGKGMGRVCRRFQVQVPMGEKISIKKKINK